MDEISVVFCTCPPEAAEGLAGGLVEARLAACVNILPQIRSIYRWDGAVTGDDEALLVIKTPAAAFEDVRLWLQRHHPYDVPEVIALPVTAGAPDYLAWVAAETGRR
jgi:periplasmic divalent cation tolerance protein